MREDKKMSDTVRRPFLFASCLLAAQLAVASPMWNGGCVKIPSL